jgi:RNA polymerase sigma factor (sigma-70 family)
MRACDLYDFRRGYKFSTYASKWILQSILNLLNEINFTIHVPRNISQTYRNVNQYIDEAVKQSGVAPTAAEISKALELNEKDVNTALRSTWVVSSLNTPVDSSAADSHEVMDLVKDEEDAYEKVDLFLQYRMVRQLIEKIPSERDRDILKRRYAIGYGESTLVDIAKVYGLTKERIRQIINGCIKNMRQELEGDEG